MRMSKDFRTTTAAHWGPTSVQKHLRLRVLRQVRTHVLAAQLLPVAISNQGEATFRVSDIPAERNIGQASTGRTL